MDGIDDLGAGPPQMQPWSENDILISGWHPDGLLGGIAELYPQVSGLDLLMSPEQRADAGIAAASSGNGASQSSPEQNLGHVSDDGLDGIRPAGWDNAGGGQSPLTIDQVDPDHLAPGRPEGMYLGDYLPHGILTPIGPLPGYPETGRAAWRSELDDQMTMGADRFNAAHGYKPGDPLYVTPQLVKSWAMQESGGDRGVFETDPMQVNTPGNWSPDKADFGLTQGKNPTPLESIHAGLEWLDRKANRQNVDGTAQTMRDALTSYRWGNPKAGNHIYADAILGRVSGAGKNGAK